MPENRLRREDCADLMNQDVSIEQHSLIRSVILHFFPGILIGGIYCAMSPLVRQMGYPSIMALVCAMIVILIPVELGYLLSHGKEKNGCFSLRGVVCYLAPIPFWQYLVGVPLLFVVLGLIFMPMKAVDSLLLQTLFAWVSALESGLHAGYSREALIVTHVFGDFGA